MKNIIIVLLRSELNYLIKYDSLRIPSFRFIDFSYDEFKRLSDDIKVKLLQNSLPIYEQEHEVILMEYSTALISYDNAPKLQFAGISAIIPLTAKAENLLLSKLDVDFKISRSLESKTYSSFVNYRNHLIRCDAGKQLCSIYKLEVPGEDFINDFKAATLFQLNNNKPKPNDTTLAHLVDFNTTPSFIPEGNIEAVIKSACVGMKKLGQEVDKITKSAFFNFVIQRKSEINNKSLFETIRYIDENTIDDDELKRFNKLKDTLSENGKYANAFLLFSYYYFLKKQMEKNHYNIEILKKDILELKHYDTESVSKVIFMLGYTFSIQTISKSLQSFSKSALLKTRKNLDLEWTPVVTQDLKIEDRKLINDQKADENDISAKRKQDEKLLSSNQNKNDELEDKRNIENKFHQKDSISTDNVNEESEEKIPVDVNNITVNNSKIDNTSALVDEDLFSNNTETINTPVFSFQKFERSIKKRKSILAKILPALKSTGIPESEITKQILIKCLIEVDEYEKQKGGLKIAAQDALKFFE